ncbi:hypothetical protein RIF29_29556 [Crotalaria pallida]|uniref:Uncharacterized protein n=1 Tax=Crotalaria pallida TaxID=3830 RepID=A0AAN9I0H7_CROPI
MARKRGRPPKTPSSSARKSPDKHAHVNDNPCRIDLSLSDEETLEAIDNLSSKKATEMLRNLEALKQWAKKVKPSKEDIENDDALRAENEVVVDYAVANANGVALKSNIDETVVGSLVSVSDANSGGSSAVRNGANMEEQMGKDLVASNFLDIVKAIWQSEVSGHAQYRVMAKLKLLKQPLKELSRRDLND